DREAPLQLALHRQIPRLDVAAVELVRQRDDGDVGWRFDNAVADADYRHNRDALRKAVRRQSARSASHPEKVIRRHDQIGQDRMVGAHRARQRIGIVADAVPGADNQLLIGTPGQADARREQSLADLYAQIGRALTDAADLNHVGAYVVSLQTAVFARRNREVFVARAVGKRQLRIDLPLIARIKAERLVARG